MNAAALNRPDYGKMLKSWMIFALCAFAVLLFSLQFKGPYINSRGEANFGYDFGLIFISASLSLMFMCFFASSEDEATAAACSLSPAGLLALTILEFAKGGEENIAFGVILAGMTILFLCLSLMWLKDRYLNRWDTVKAYAMCTSLAILLAGISLLAIRYLF